MLSLWDRVLVWRYRRAGKQFLDMWSYRQHGSIQGFNSMLQRWKSLELQYCQRGFRPIPLKDFEQPLKIEPLEEDENPTLWAGVFEKLAAIPIPVVFATWTPESGWSTNQAGVLDRGRFQPKEES